MGQLHTYIYGYNQIIDNLQQIYNKTKNINQKQLKFQTCRHFNYQTTIGSIEQVIKSPNQHQNQI